MYTYTVKNNLINIYIYIYIFIDERKEQPKSKLGTKSSWPEHLSGAETWATNTPHREREGNSQSICGALLVFSNGVFQNLYLISI